MPQTNFVKRKIPLAEFNSNETIHSDISALTEQAGVQNVVLNSRDKSVKIEYDQLLTNYSRLLTILSDLGISYRDTLGFRIRKSWYDYLDINTRENALAPPPACCNRPPRK